MRCDPVFQIRSWWGLRNYRMFVPSRKSVAVLGPPNSSLQRVLDRIRRKNPSYKVDLLTRGLVHVYPAHGTADPSGLLGIRLQESFLPPDNCLQPQMDRMGSVGAVLSYTPELSQYLLKKEEECNRKHGGPVFGIAGDSGGQCKPSQQRRDPIHRNITVREAMNLMSIRSLQIARMPSYKPAHATRGRSAGSSVFAGTRTQTLASVACRCFKHFDVTKALRCCPNRRLGRSLATRGC